ncbi:hypothetical protein [Fibrella aquatilis]|uniref:Uncharacterized protein n=1 Tax=Fibrella aquatilis TaxID=2817059 RepID=A0A939K2Z6_9BACT|nr:hypothetical protein [Fibrella aquatilis]MBO0934601.1 hypothetical protein [Fibrella aquatilis]
MKMSPLNWLLLGLAVLAVWYFTRPKAPQGVIQGIAPNRPISSGGSSSGGSSSGGGDTTPTPPAGTTETITTSLPTWLTQVGYSHDTTSRDTNIWLIGTGLLQVKLEQGNSTLSGDGWTLGNWHNVATDGFIVAPYTGRKSYNKGTGVGLADGVYTLSVRRTSTPLDVYQVSVTMGQTSGTITMIAGPVQNTGGGTGGGTGGNGGGNGGGTINSLADFVATTYGPPTKVFMDSPALTIQIGAVTNGRFALTATSNVQPGNGRMLLTVVDNFIDRDLHLLDGSQTYEVGSRLQIKLYEVNSNDDDLNLIANGTFKAKQEIYYPV